jgi:hypothetical protein
LSVELLLSSGVRFLLFVLRGSFLYWPLDFGVRFQRIVRYTQAGSHKRREATKFSSPNSSRTIFSVPESIKQRDRIITMSTQHSSLNYQPRQLAPQQSAKGSIDSKNNGISRRPFQPLSSNADRPTADKVSFRFQTRFRVLYCPNGPF